MRGGVKGISMSTPARQKPIWSPRRKRSDKKLVKIVCLLKFIPKTGYAFQKPLYVSCTYEGFQTHLPFFIPNLVTYHTL